MAEPVMKPEQAPVESAPVKELTQLQLISRRFRRNKLAVFGLAFLLAFYLVAAFAPQLARQPLNHIDVPQRLQSPSWEYPMGTDHLGRDVLSRLIWGSRVSLSVGFVAMGMALTLGTLVGAVAGFYGGSWIDIILMRIAEAIDIIPTFFLLITIVAVIRPNIFNVMLIIGFTAWPRISYIVRGQFLSLRQRDYTEASRAMGATDRRLIFRHIMPNAAAAIIVAATLGIGSAILTESALSFLGLGTQHPQVSWGQMLSLGRPFLRNAPWIAIWPGVAIFLVVLSFNFMGDGLRDALDPKMKR